MNTRGARISAALAAALLGCGGCVSQKVAVPEGASVKSLTVNMDAAAYKANADTEDGEASVHTRTPVDAKATLKE